MAKDLTPECFPSKIKKRGKDVHYYHSYPTQNIFLANKKARKRRKGIGWKRKKKKRLCLQIICLSTRMNLQGKISTS